MAFDSDLAHLTADRVRLTEDAELVLDVVGDLVRDDIGRCEVSRGTQLPRHRRKEVGVEVNLLVTRAVERAGRSTGAAAAALRHA